MPVAVQADTAAPELDMQGVAANHGVNPRADAIGLGDAAGRGEIDEPELVLCIVGHHLAISDCSLLISPVEVGGPSWARPAVETPVGLGARER